MYYETGKQPRELTLEEYKALRFCYIPNSPEQGIKK